MGLLEGGVTVSVVRRLTDEEFKDLIRKEEKKKKKKEEEKREKKKK